MNTYIKKILVLGLGLLFVLSCAEKKDKKGQQEVVTSETPIQWLEFNKNSDAKHIVFVSGDEEYRSEEALPQLAKIMANHHGFKCTVLFAQDPSKPGIVNANYVRNIPGLEALETADVLVLFTRFRALPDNQMAYFENYLKQGKPIVGIRTATHAFNFEKDSLSSYVHYGNYYQGDKNEWHDGFGRLVLGEKWISHHGKHKYQSTRGILSEFGKAHPISNGLVDKEIWGPTDVYGVRLPLPGDAQPIVMGQVIQGEKPFDENDLFYGMQPTDSIPASKNEKGEDLNSPMMPIAWIKSYQIPEGVKGQAFTSTIGAATDLLNEGVRRLLVNAIFWTAGSEVPEKADVQLVGDYQPTAFEFRDDAYWLEKELTIESLK